LKFKKLEDENRFDQEGIHHPSRCVNRFIALLYEAFERLGQECVILSWGFYWGGKKGIARMV